MGKNTLSGRRFGLLRDEGCAAKTITADRTADRAEDVMILVHQRYFAKPGLREQVIETRIEASRRLADLGVPVGQIWVPVRGRAGIDDAGLPDLIWECTYPTLEEREAIRARQESDPRFHAIRTHQGTQLAQWVREHYRLLEMKG
jgi:hypothetical protein